MQEISEKPKSTEFILMKSKIRKDVKCKGRMPLTRKECATNLYQSDGEFIFISGLVLNPDLDVQFIVCENCGYEMQWRRNDEFIKKNNSKQRRQWRSKMRFQSKT